MKAEKHNAHTADELRYMQALPLDVKVRMTKDRIRAFTNQFDAYVAFSGGKDSTVLLDIARQVVPDIPAVFCDTGLEYPEIRDFVKSIENVTWLKPKMGFKDVILKYGYPVISKEISKCIYETKKSPSGYKAKRFAVDYEPKRFCLYRYRYLLDVDIPISHKCCYYLKKQPFDKYNKDTNRRRIAGMLAEESFLRKITWIRYGCNVFDEKNARSAPLSFWTEQDILRYIKQKNLPIASVYGEIVEDENGKLQTTGEHRTGCMFCAFGAHLEKEPNRFQRLKEIHPKVWEYCMKPVEDGGLGMARVLDAIGVKYDDYPKQLHLEEEK